MFNKKGISAKLRQEKKYYLDGEIILSHFNKMPTALVYSRFIANMY